MKVFNLNKFSETSRSLIVIKFILVVLELILTCLSLGATHQNIMAGLRTLPTSDEYSNAYAYIVIFEILCILFELIEISLNMFALNIHFDKCNSILCVYHFIGIWTYFCFLFDRWRYKTIMYIWIVFCLIPLCLEFFTSLNGYFYYGVHEHRINEAKRQLQIQEYLKKKQEKLDEERRQQQEDEGQLLNDGNQNVISQ